LTSFVGRERELDEIWSLFREGKRLVTVIDTGAHVFQNFYPILDEAADALDRAGQLLTAHLARKPA
jgi:endonuclease IV